MSSITTRKNSGAALETVFEIFLGIVFTSSIIYILDLFLTYKVVAGDNWNDEQNRTVTLVRGVIALICAAAMFGASLKLKSSLKIFKNGLFLAGMFTVIYSLTNFWTATDGNKILGLLVVLLSLSIAVVIGWLRFVRGLSTDGQPLTTAESSQGSPASSPIANAEIEDRVSQLERRLASMAKALEE